jgi:hypothetical protein
MTKVSSNLPGGRWSMMDLDLLRRVRSASIVFGAVLAIPLSFYFGWASGLSWVAGIAWSLVNLTFITSLVKNVITLEDRSILRIALALAVKFPVLYIAGWLMLRQGLPPLWIVAGFTWPFFVLVLKAGGRAYMKMDENGEPQGTVS